jgi:DNA helicase-2/ATP-dependent DNA helicase PcrA
MYLVVFDLETGGTDHSRHPVIQVAAVAMEIEGMDWKQVGQFERKLQFDISEADPHALEINSYNPDVWEAEAVKPHDAVSALKNWASKYADVRRVAKKSGREFYCVRTGGHNINTFDHPFLRKLFKSFNEFSPFDFMESFDSLELAKWLFRFFYPNYEIENFKLGTLCDAYGIDTDGAHDALNDVVMNSKLIWAMRYCKPKQQEED